MGQLKKESIKKCLGMLEEFIEGADDMNNKKGPARLALIQLQRITAGEDLMLPLLSCTGRPRAEII